MASTYRVGYQVCDDSTARAGGWDFAQCQTNGRNYAANASVVGIIGTFNSGCARIILPLVNAAAGGAILMISPANTYLGLTRRGPGREPGDPAPYYPTGVRNYLRLTPADTFQGAAHAQWTRRLGKRRVYVLADGDAYGNGLGADYIYAARRLGLVIVGNRTWNRNAPNYRALAQRIKASRAGVVFVGGIIDNNGGKLLRDLRAVLGPKVILQAADGFTPVDSVQELAGASGNGLYISIGGPAFDRLPARGNAFITAFDATTTSEFDVYAVYAAQATETLLDAIGRSNGTRASVLTNLFATNTPDGLIGSVAFDANGDLTRPLVTMYRAVRVQGRLRARSVAVVRVSRKVRAPRLTGWIRIRTSTGARHRLGQRVSVAAGSPGSTRCACRPWSPGRHWRPSPSVDRTAQRGSRRFRVRQQARDWM